MATVQTATPKKTTTWQVDPAHTHVEFAVKHLMIATVRGRFSDVAGTVIVDPYGNNRAGFSATGKINRKDFGLGWNQLLETGGVVVGDEGQISQGSRYERKPL
jgi:polyisoprenoid-binding protein YceI